MTNQRAKPKPSPAWEVPCRICDAKKGSICTVVGDRTRGLRTTRVSHNARWLDYFRTQSNEQRQSR